MQTPVMPLQVSLSLCLLPLIGLQSSPKICNEAGKALAVLPSQTFVLAGVLSDDYCDCVSKSS